MPLKLEWVHHNHMESLSNHRLLTPLPQDIQTEFPIQRVLVSALLTSSQVMLSLPSGDHTLSSTVIRHFVKFSMSSKHKEFLIEKDGGLIPHLSWPRGIDIFRWILQGDIVVALTKEWILLIPSESLMDFTLRFGDVGKALCGLEWSTTVSSSEKFLNPWKMRITLYMYMELCKTPSLSFS